MKPLVSVVLPVYNQEAHIANAVQSILDQTLIDFELIIINDGSSDGTADVLKSFQDPRIRIYSTTNRGISRALNFGIKLSKADIIARMDADDISHPERLQKQYDYLKSNKTIGLVSCCVSYGGNRKKNLGYAIYVDGINKLLAHQEMFNKRFQDSPMAHPSVMFKKSLFYKYGGYQESELPEDYELWLRWMNKGVLFHKLKDNLLIWNDLSDRISRNNEAYSDDNFNKVKANYLAEHLKKEGKLPPIWIWGIGKKVNTAVKYLKDYGFTIEKYIDVKQNHSSKSIIHYSNIPNPGEHIILSIVGDRVGKKEIEKYLLDRGYTEGTDFFLMN